MTDQDPEHLRVRESLLEAVIGAQVGVVPRLLHELGTNTEALRQAGQRTQ